MGSGINYKQSKWTDLYTLLNIYLSSIKNYYLLGMKEVKDNFEKNKNDLINLLITFNNEEFNKLIILLKNNKLD